MSAADRLTRARRNLAALEASPHREVLGKQIATAQALVDMLEADADSELWAVVA